MIDYSRVLVTGANGFIGNTLFKHLRGIGLHSVLGTTRISNSTNTLNDESLLAMGDLNTDTDWLYVLRDQQVIIHTAARAHIMKDEVSDPLVDYRRVNVEGSLHLAKQAAKAGVKRFIFISSIKVNGEGRKNNHAYFYDDQPAPEDAYGISKAEAEAGLRQIAAETGMEIVIIRPTLVYGLGVKGNFSALMGLACRGLPLPLGAIHNCRSMVALDNLIDLIITCIDHPNAANQTFLVSDDQDVSTTELLQKMAHAFGKKTRLIPIPMNWIRVVASLLGKKAVADRLCGSLQVDITHTKETLGWKPPVTMEQQLAKIAASMQSSSRDV